MMQFKVRCRATFFTTVMGIPFYLRRDNFPKRRLKIFLIQFAIILLNSLIVHSLRCKSFRLNISVCNINL